MTLSKLQHRRAVRRVLWNRIGYTPHPKQQAYHDARDAGAVRIYKEWGRRCGKSLSSGSEALTDMAFAPHGLLPKNNVLLVAPEADSTDAIFEPLWRWIVDQRVFGVDPIAKSVRMRYIELPWHSYLQGKTSKDPTSLRGPGNTATYADEYAFGDDILMEYLMPPLMDTGGVLDITTTPNGLNHAHQLAEHWDKQMREGNARYCYIHATSFDNPHNDHNELRDMEKQAHALGTFDLFEQEVYAKPGALKGAVYPMFDESFHVGECEPMLGSPVHTSYDWGFHNPFAGLVFQVLEDDRIFVYDEIYERGLDDEEKASRASEMISKTGCELSMSYADPSSPSAIKTFRGRGIIIWQPSDQESLRRINNVLEGIAAVRGVLSRKDKPGLVIHPRCKNLISEMKSYRFKDKLPSGKDAPVKEDDHACDALRYGALGTVGNKFVNPFLFST